MPENLVLRDGFSRPDPRQPAHLHTTQAESGAYLRDSSRVPRRRPFMKPPYAIGSVPSLSGHHAIAYRWRSLPRVRRHRASKPQGSSERVLPWQVTMDQSLCASLSHTHYYWYEVGMLKARRYLQKAQDTIIHLKVDEDVDSHMQHNVLVTEETTTTVTQRVSLRPYLSNANPARGHKDVRRSMDHISNHPMTSETYRRQNKSLSSKYSFYCLYSIVRPNLSSNINHLKIIVVRALWFLV